jgi:hypothetical protein
VTERVVIDLSDLRAVAASLLDHLTELEGSEVSLEHDMFWSVGAPAIFNVYAQPEDLSIGQLSESWENLRRMTDEDRSLTYGLEWLADVLRAIGLEIVQ